MAKNEHSGYPLKWFNDQNAARNFFECAICLEILKDPVQVRDCGHQFCELCIEDILKTDPRCPSCRIDISQAMIFKDLAAIRLIRKLDVNCCNEGCSWIGSLSSLLEDHVNSCSFFVSIVDKNVQDLDKKLEERFETLMKEISTLKEKHEDDNKEIKSKHEDDIKEIKSKHEDDIKAIKSKHEDDVREIMLTHQKDFRGLQQEITLLQLTTNCGGISTIKIDNFSKRLSHAKDFCELGTISEAFYHHYRYKMMFSVHLSEASQGFTGYMGVSLKLMRSEYGMLRWPFTKTCTFIVMDQDDKWKNEDHMVNRVLNGQNENASLDILQFILHSTLSTRKYIKADVVYVKVIVER